MCVLRLQHGFIANNSSWISCGSWRRTLQRQGGRSLIFMALGDAAVVQRLPCVRAAATGQFCSILRGTDVTVQSARISGRIKGFVLSAAARLHLTVYTDCIYMTCSDRFHWNEFVTHAKSTQINPMQPAQKSGQLGGVAISPVSPLGPQAVPRRLSRTPP